jgi:hypothetical protein
MRLAFKLGGTLEKERKVTVEFGNNLTITFLGLGLMALILGALQL